MIRIHIIVIGVVLCIPPQICRIPVNKKHLKGNIGFVDIASLKTAYIVCMCFQVSQPHHTLCSHGYTVYLSLYNMLVVVA